MQRVALVTGGSRGIGRAISVALGEAGNRVVINYASNVEAAEETAKAVEAAGGEAMIVAADVGDAAAVDDLFEQVAAGFGPVEILVNNAGITRDGLLLRMSQENWDEVLRVDLTSVFLCTKAAMRAMVKARWGRIITISSVAGLTGNAGQANYAAAKAGAIGFTKAISKEVGSRSITANVIAPGFIETDLTAPLAGALRNQAAELTSVGRLGSAQEVASVVGYLASEQASYVTGQVIRVDGGMVL
ncbi:MAG: 3-oxoacyl-[acyl-carrier-protein] reductase [Acidimicrobiia bacterium]|nr:3-oxoacyl-[acyl-carrier-protein] reductase [Acidimicrobiia bacterium]